MLNRFTDFIKEKELFSPESLLIVATSGGMDSVTLCHLLHKTGYNFAIAHCNFGLRGEESDQDEQFVKKLAKKYKVPFFVKHFETTEFAEEGKISTQMAARYLRYQWFEELLIEENAEKILTAHHKSDVAETILLNLTRGTGIAGLHGIRPLSGNIARPLLFATREDIMEVVEANQLKWREDSSNESTKYQRNYIRHEIIPLLKQLNPSFEETIERSAEKIASAEVIFNEEIEKTRQKSVITEKNTVRIDFSQIRTQSKPLIRFFEILKIFNFNYSQCNDIFLGLDSEPGKVFESPTHTLIKDRVELIITPKDISSFSSAEIPENTSVFHKKGIELEFKTFDAELYKISTSPTVAAFDKDKVEFPLEIRKWKDGDWFFPLGMNKKKKLSDFLIDNKVPLNLKSRTFVLSSNGSIIWVVGRRIDNRFKVTDKTSKVLEIRLLAKDD